MAFCNRLREARIKSGYSQTQLAQILGIGLSTLSNYEAGIREPSLTNISKFIDELDIDANFLFQDDITVQNKLSISDIELIKKYHSLDESSKSFVDLVIDRECNRPSEI